MKTLAAQQPGFLAIESARHETAESPCPIGKVWKIFAVGKPTSAICRRRNWGATNGIRAIISASPAWKKNMDLTMNKISAHRFLPIAPEGRIIVGSVLAITVLATIVWGASAWFFWIVAVLITQFFATRRAIFVWNLMKLSLPPMDAWYLLDARHRRWTNRPNLKLVFL